MIRAVIDTNVLVSAFSTHNPDSPTIRIYYAILRGDVIVLHSPGIIAEYEDVLHRDKFSFTQGIPAVVARLHATTIPSDFCPRFRGGSPPKFPCRTVGTRHVPMPRPVGRAAKRLRRVRAGFRYHDPLGHGRPFG